jgi:hypothetical protein
MNNLFDEPRGTQVGAPPLERLIPMAGAMTVLCVLLFGLLFLI